MRRCLLACPILSLLLAIAPANAQVLNFGWVNVGTAVPHKYSLTRFPVRNHLSAVDILTAGAPGRDYSEGGSSTCAVNATYSAGQSCTVTVAFTPSAPGLRSGGVVLFVQGSNLPLMTWYLNGVGQSGAITIDPGTESTIGPLSGGGQGYGMAMDGAGNLYVADHANNQVIELPFGSFTQRTVVSSGLASPTAVALDGAGNLYISDTGNGRVAVVPNEQTGLNGLDISTVDIAGLGAPIGIAVDGSGNLYVADGIANDVIEVPPGGGTPATIASALPSPWVWPSIPAETSTCPRTMQSPSTNRHSREHQSRSAAATATRTALPWMRPARSGLRTRVTLESCAWPQQVVRRLLWHSQAPPTRKAWRPMPPAICMSRAPVLSTYSIEHSLRRSFSAILSSDRQVGRRP